jgi:hypothetical protein
MTRRPGLAAILIVDLIVLVSLVELAWRAFK